MTDYKNMCGWRRFVMVQRRRKAVRAVLFTVMALLIYGFVGFLDQEPVVVDETRELFFDIPRDVLAKSVAMNEPYTLDGK